MAHRPGRSAALGGLLLAGVIGCLRPNPDFNPGASATGTSSGATEGATSATATSATATSSGSEGGTSAAQGSDGASAGTSTTGPADSSSSTSSGLCAQVGEACDSVGCCTDACATCQAGVCVSSCATCEACAAGHCSILDGAPCQLEIGERCEDFIAGPSDIGCRLYPPAPGVCGPDGACLRQCAGVGGFAPGGKCDQRCSHEEACVPNSPAASFVPAAYCTFDDLTETCRPACNENGVGAETIDYECDWMGQCVPMASHNCGFYACNRMGTACLAACEGPTDASTWRSAPG